MAAAGRSGSQQARDGSLAMVLAGAAFALFVANAILGKASLLLDASAPVHLGNVAEFALLVLAVVCFVAAILGKERARGDQSSMEQPK